MTAAVEEVEGATNRSRMREWESENRMKARVKEGEKGAWPEREGVFKGG